MNKLFTILLLLSNIAIAQVTGAGATFPAPLYAKWAEAYNKSGGLQINYQSIGSGAGLKQIEAKTVAFGASDMPLTNEKLKEVGLFQFPTVIGGVVPVINVKGIEMGQLKLTGHILAEIYMTKITKWDDPAIKALNPKLSLPSEEINIVRRADSSGTTFLWTNYLSKVNKEFHDTIGEGTTVNWKKGAGGKGNEGVSAMVKQLHNSIGYVEYAYVKQTKMNWVQIQNAAGIWVSPTEDAFKAAASNVDWNKTYYQILTNQLDKAAWPISGATFILVYVKPNHPAPVIRSLLKTQTEEVLKFFDWAFANGDKLADELDYVALPINVKNKIREDWKKLGLM